METFDFCTLTPISTNEIKKLKDISPIIKYDLFKYSEIYIVKMNNDNLTRFSPEIRFIRKFNRENAPKHQFIFNIDGGYIFYVIASKKTCNLYEPYNDEILEYAYGNK